MKGGLYSKIAVDNVRKNARLYVPRILTEAGLSGCFYILVTLAMDRRLSDAVGGSVLPTFMWMGAVVLGLLSLILILYINSFLMKRRKSEYGLYNVLGLEKRHITKVLFSESLLASILSVALGVVFGLLFYKLSSLLICRLLRTEIVAGFYYLAAPTVLLSAVVFLGLDFFAFLVNAAAIRRMNPAALLAEQHTGEKEPKTRRALLFVGVVALGAGYAIALSTKSPLQAIFLFFAAVILVIVGTYCLFVTGTTFVLQSLKKNKSYYYNKRHMPAVAGLLFRMKQNAVGMASIAILATGVLVMVSTTVSLYSGIQDTMETNYPQQLYLSAYNYSEGNAEIAHVPFEGLKTVVQEAAEENGVTIQKIGEAQMLSVSYLQRDGTLLTKNEVTDDWNLDDLIEAVFITQETYRQLRGATVRRDDFDAAEPEQLALEKNEIAFCPVSTSAEKIGGNPQTLTIHGAEYKVKQDLFYFPVGSNMSAVVDVIGIVVADDDVLDAIYRAQKEGYGEHASEYASRISVTFTDETAASAAGEEIDAAIREKLRAAYPGDLSVTLDTKWDALHNVLEMYGTFLFLGILLGFVFLFSTILIIYYKQISEGYEDRRRFQIMEKIGMSAGEVKKTIGSQLVLQFFLPLVTSGVHTAFAFPILLKLLRVLMLTNTALFIVCTAVTFVLFALVYTAVFLLTRKTYYKIVH